MQTPRLSAAAAVFLALAVGPALIGSARAAAEDGPAILYSYEKFVLGNDVQYVLVPRPSKLAVNTDAPLSPALITGLFNELRDTKRATYGGSTIDVNPAGLKKGQATVKLDESKERYAVIVVAEVITTMARLGVEKITFVGYDKRPLGVEDVEFGVFELSMPAWRCLPPRRIAPTSVVMPGGQVLSDAAFYAAIDKKDESIVKMVESYMKDDDSNIVLTAIRALPLMKLTDWEKLVLPALKHPDDKVRLGALEALDGNESEEVLAAIGDVMDKDKEAAVGQKAAEVLGKSKNKKYAVFAMYYQMRGNDEAAGIKAIDEILKMKEPSAATELVKAARGPRDAIALRAIEALGGLGAVGELKPLFTDAKLALERRLAAAAQVKGLPDADARFAALAFIATDGKPADANAAIDELARLTDPAPRAKIEAALDHKASEVRRHAGEVLTGLKDPASLKALAKAAETYKEDEEALQTSASIIMGNLALNDILGYTTNKNIILRRVCYESLGNKVKGGGNKRVLDVLGQGIKDKDDGIRASAAKGLLAFTDDAALKLLLDAGADKSAPVRRNVARALANWPAGKATGRDLLVTYITDADGSVIEAAVDTLRGRKETETFDQILALYKVNRHPDPEVRGAVLKAIHELANEKQKQTVIGALSGAVYDADKRVKFLAITLLGAYDNAAAVTGLASLINDPAEDLRIASLGALGSTRSTDAVELIVSVASDPKKTVRIAAVEALGENGRPAAADALKKIMAVERDVDVLKAAKAALKKIN